MNREDCLDNERMAKVATSAVQKPSIGQIVHFVQKKPIRYGDDKLVTLPAIITAVWGDTCVNLQVFTDGTNSDDFNISPVKWITSLTLDDSVEPQPRTWHWPPRV